MQAGRIKCPTKYMVNRVAVVVGGWRGGEGAQRMVKLFLPAESEVVVVGERKILVMIRAPAWCDKPVSVPRPGTMRLCEKARGNPYLLSRSLHLPNQKSTPQHAKLPSSIITA